MDPTTVEASLVALNALLTLIAQIRAASGLTNDQLVAAAKAKFADNDNNIHTILANLP